MSKDEAVAGIVESQARRIKHLEHMIDQHEKTIANMTKASAEFREAERQVSDAYLRIREKLAASLRKAIAVKERIEQQLAEYRAEVSELAATVDATKMANGILRADLLSAQAEAGIYRELLEAAAQCLDDENERLKEQGGNVRVLIEDNVRFAATIRDALATDAGEKAAAVIAAATEFWRDRTQRIGPLDPSVVDRLLAAVAAMEKGDG